MTNFYCTFYSIEGDTITSHLLKNVPNIGDKIKPVSGRTYLIKVKVQVLQYTTDPIQDYEEFEFIVEETNNNQQPEMSGSLDELMKDDELSPELLKRINEVAIKVEDAKKKPMTPEEQQNFLRKLAEHLASYLD